MLQDMESKMSSQLEGAEREQRNIYMQLVPKDVPEVTPKKMVQPKEPAELLNRPEEWFSDIVPDKVTRHLSKCVALPQLCSCGFLSTDPDPAASHRGLLSGLVLLESKKKAAAWCCWNRN